MIFKLTLFILFNLVYGLSHKHIKAKRDSGCSNGASELPVSFELGYWNGGSSSNLKDEAVSASENLKNMASSNQGLVSFSYFILICVYAYILFFTHTY